MSRRQYKHKCDVCEVNFQTVKKVQQYCSRKCMGVSSRGHSFYGKKETQFKKGHPQLNTGRTHFKKGLIPWCAGTKGLVKAWNKGKKVPQITGESHYLWKGGVSLTKGYHNFYKNQYKHRKKGAIGSHTKEEWKDLKEHYQFMCVCCKKQNVELTEDHIIPLSKGGSNNIENIQPLCRSCNGKKIDKTINYRDWCDDCRPEPNKFIAVDDVYDPKCSSCGKYLLN